MSRLIKATAALSSVLFLTACMQVQAAGAGASKGGGELLAQKVEPEKGKAPIPVPPPSKPEQHRVREQPQPQMEKMPRRTRSLGSMSDDVEKAGTKKIGGQSIRAKDNPPGGITPRL